MAFTAVTVKVDELPDVIEAGSAVMVTVGAGIAVTDTIAMAEAWPPAPFATAVYVVVAAGLTACVPPIACRGYVLPSLPVTVTWVEFVAVTVKIAELPEVIDIGFAAMVTAGAGLAMTVTTAVAVAVPPAPVAVAV